MNGRGFGTGIMVVVSGMVRCWGEELLEGLVSLSDNCSGGVCDEEINCLVLFLSGETAVGCVCVCVCMCMCVSICMCVCMCAYYSNMLLSHGYC